jgi:hypothetical protein
LQVVAFLLGPPGGGDDAIAELVEERDCDRTNPTRQHQSREHISPVWRDACFFQSQHTKHGRIASLRRFADWLEIADSQPSALAN